MYTQHLEDKLKFNLGKFERKMALVEMSRNILRDYSHVDSGIYKKYEDNVFRLARKIEEFVNEELTKTDE